jgi:hypothetical protein
MVAIDFTLLAVTIPMLAGAAIGLVAGNIYVGGGAAAILLSWIAAQVQNEFVTAAWLLLLVFMALAVGREMTSLMLGDTA